MNGQREYTQPQGESDPQHEDRPILQRLENHFGRRMFSGLLVLIPLLATVLILRLVFSYVDGIFRGEGGFFTPFIEDTILDFPGIGVVFTLVLFYSVGLLVTGRAGKRAIDWQKVILSKIPIVGSIFEVAQQATDALTSPTGHQYSRVVFLEWPRAGVLAMGFVTGHCHYPGDHERMILAIYIPTVPNPTSGMLAFVSEDDIIESDLTVEDAMKMVFSGGIVLPASMQIRPDAVLPPPPMES